MRWTLVLSMLDWEKYEKKTNKHRTDYTRRVHASSPTLWRRSDSHKNGARNTTWNVKCTPYFNFHR